MEQQQLKEFIETLDVYIVSHGGVASNALNSFLQSKGIRCGYSDLPTAMYYYFCHYPAPLTNKTPCIYIHGDYTRSIISQYKRNILSLNAKKMQGIDLEKKMTLKELIHKNPADPLGIWNQKKNFQGASNTWCLEYPFHSNDLDRIFKEMGLEVDVSTFPTTPRTSTTDNNTFPFSSRLQYILSVYSKDSL